MGILSNYITETIKSLRYVSVDENGVTRRKLVLHPLDNEHFEVDMVDSPRGEIGSVAYFTTVPVAFATSSGAGVSIPGASIQVVVLDRPLKVTVSATLLAALANTLAAVYVYQDATIIGYLHWTSPSDVSYQALSKSFRVNPPPGIHGYSAYLASYTDDAVSIYSIDSASPGVEIIVEEI